MSNDTSIATAGLKVCCACGAEVSGQPRMKDSRGRYWCVPCGEADQRNKQITSTRAHCAGCHKSFPKGKLDPHAGAFYCKSCLKKAKSATGTWHMGPGIAAAATNTDRPAQVSGPKAHAPQTDRKRLVIMASVLVALVLLALVINFVLLGD